MIEITTKRKKQLRDNIYKLSFMEHEEIFKMLKNNDLNFTQNKNGTFIDITNLDGSIFTEVENFVTFCLKNKQELDDYDKKINECKINNTFDKIPGSVSLTNALVVKNTDNWQELLNTVKDNEKVNAFVNLIDNNSEKFNIKKTNTRFMNIKKKYSKIYFDKKVDQELQNVLFKE